MQFRSFRLDSNLLGTLFAPRKPRAPLLRLALGLLGLVLLAVLVFFSVFVGAAMIAAGLAWKLLRRRQARPATGKVVDAEYRILRKPVLPAPQ
jgi:energy-converting hydrogenase Eha subunit G